MGDMAALAVAAWAVRPTSPSCLRKVIRSTKPWGLDEETVVAPFVERLVSELASRATPASSSSAPPARPLATAPVPVASPPIAASTGGETIFVVVVPNTLASISFLRAARPTALRTRFPGRRFPSAVALLGSPASMRSSPAARVPRPPAGTTRNRWVAAAAGGGAARDGEGGSLASYSGKDQRVRGGGLAGIHGGEAKKGRGREMTERGEVKECRIETMAYQVQLTEVKGNDPAGGHVTGKKLDLGGNGRLCHAGLQYHYEWRKSTRGDSKKAGAENIRLEIQLDNCSVVNSLTFEFQKGSF
uniref:Uncharacterized protein n=1 Tax=Oryza rufipogon TaxID=4529 RepID=A0A0E0MRP4_ORYRU